jgi:hypothetical protein
LRNVTAIEAGWLRDRKMMYGVGESPVNIDDNFPPCVYIIQEKHPLGWRKWIRLIHTKKEHKGTVEKI